MRFLPAIALLLPLLVFGQGLTEGKQPDVPAGTSVLSPNRTPGSVLAARTTATRAPKVARPATTAPMWVDATGAAVGRLYQGNGILVTVAGKTVSLQVGPHCDQWSQPDPGRSPGCSHYAADNGAQVWPAGSLFFPSTDCSGTPYSGVELGFQAKAVSLFDPSDGKQYVFVFYPGAARTSLTVNSEFDYYNGCYLLNTPITQDYFVPVSAVLPVESFGTPPFYLH